MTLEDKVTYFLQCEFEASGYGTKRQAAVLFASGCMDNIWETMNYTDDEDLSVDGLIKHWFLTEVEAEAGDEDFTNALKQIIKLHEGE